MKIKQHMVQIFHGWLCPTTAVVTGHCKRQIIPSKACAVLKTDFCFLCSRRRQLIVDLLLIVTCPVPKFDAMSCHDILETENC